MKVLSDNGVSKVWLAGDFVYKEQPKHLTDNEIWCLEKLYPSGYVPFAEQVELEIIRTRHIITADHYAAYDYDGLMQHAEEMLKALGEAGIRHGDLTEYSVLIHMSGKPYMIDFAESRLACDPRPDKRPEGDRYWLTKTMEKYANGLI